MIYLKLRQAGEGVNYKRVARLYVAERLQVRRRRRKRVPLADRQPRGFSESHAHQHQTRKLLQNVRLW